MFDEIKGLHIHCSLLCTHFKSSVLLYFNFCLYNLLIFFICSVRLGNVLCLVCRRKLCSNLCPICLRVIGYNCCFALEQMIDAVKVPCSNSIFGCNKYITYYQKEKHEKKRMHMLHASVQKMVAHLKNQQDCFSITLSPSTNGPRQTSVMTSPKEFPSRGTAGSCSWSGRTSPCS